MLTNGKDRKKKAGRPVIVDLAEHRKKAKLKAEHEKKEKKLPLAANDLHKEKQQKSVSIRLQGIQKKLMALYIVPAALIVAAGIIKREFYIILAGVLVIFIGRRIAKGILDTIAAMEGMLKRGAGIANLSGQVRMDAAALLLAVQDICIAVEEVRGGIAGQAEDARECLKQSDELSKKAEWLSENAEIITNFSNNAKKIVNESIVISDGTGEKSNDVNFQYLSRLTEIMSKRTSMFLTEVKNMDVSAEITITAMENISAISEVTADTFEEIDQAVLLRSQELKRLAAVAESLDKEARELKNALDTFKI